MSHIDERSFLLLKDDDDDDDDKRGMGWNEVKTFCLSNTVGTMLEMEYKLSLCFKKVHCKCCM